MVHSVLSNICHDLGWKLIWLTIKILSVFPFFHLWPLTIFSFLCNDARMVVWSILKSDKAWSRLSEDYIILQNIKVNFILGKLYGHICIGSHIQRLELHIRSIMQEAQACQIFTSLARVTWGTLAHVVVRTWQYHTHAVLAVVLLSVILFLLTCLR